MREKKHGMSLLKQSSNQELSNCTFIKTILMIIIVFYHSVSFWNSWFTKDPIYSSEILKQIALWMNSFHIYAFALVSGYLYYFLRIEKGRYAKFIPFLRNKINRLIVPYIFVAVVWVIPIQTMFFKYDATTIFQKYILGTGPSQLWFLLMLFVLFIIFYPLSNFFVKNTFVGAVVVIGIYGVSIIGGQIVPNFFQIWTGCLYLPLFWIGFKLRQYGTVHIRKIPIFLWLSADILLFILTQYLATFDGFIYILLGIGIGFMLHIVGAIMAFVILQKLADKLAWQENKAFQLISKQSMPIYLFHQQVIYFFIYWFNGVVNPYVNASINFVGAMAISMLLSSVLLKFKYTRFLIGEK